jgi:hypothetical protein
MVCRQTKKNKTIALAPIERREKKCQKNKRHGEFLRGSGHHKIVETIRNYETPSKRSPVVNTAPSLSIAVIINDRLSINWTPLCVYTRYWPMYLFHFVFSSNGEGFV